jgi:3',5'-cyclic AMP phosphodiesterase CpdA
MGAAALVAPALGAPALFVAASAEAAEAANPALLPQRVLLSWSDDPKHSQSATWRTEGTTDTPQAQLASWSANAKFAEGAAVVNATVKRVPLGDGEVSEYQVDFTGLQPNSRYGYRVGDGTTWSPWYHFRTASETPEPFRFVYMGDAQTNLSSMWSRTTLAALLQAPDMRFIAHAGDLVNRGHQDPEWGEWCAALGPIGATIPQVPAPGNHDEKHADGTEPSMTQVASWWRHRFALPNNGPKGYEFLHEESYYVDYQGLRIVVLDTNLYDDEPDDPQQPKVAESQTKWLEEVLANNPNRWTIVMHHHPLYSTGSERDNVELRAALLPIYDKYHVDLVLQGHDHYYGRTKKLFDNKIVEPNAPGTVYAVSVSGPKMYRKNTIFEPLMAKMQGDTQMFQVIDVSNEKLTYRAYDVAGATIDGFELMKDQDGKTTMQEVTA